MDSEKLKQIEEIYHAALEIEPEKREFFLREICGADEHLRREVESLLAFEEHTDQFLSTPPESLAAEMIAGKSNSSDLPGAQIGRYKIRKLLGKGGMGEVFLAEDTELERFVAIKILHADFSDDSHRVNRFIREAKSVSALNHPNILTIYETGIYQNSHFIVTEYIEGKTLREKMLRKDLELQEILDIAAQIAAALTAAHSAGIIHRDIKPENVILRNDGLVKVLDFGLAKLAGNSIENNGLDNNQKEALTQKLALTNPGMILGTASYMSPEQIRGRADIDARSDIWSLGVVTFEMLTGSVPFSGESVSDIIASILKTDAPMMSKYIENCPTELERIVTKTLQKKRDERYQNIKDLALDLKFLKRDLEFSAEFNRISNSGERKISEIPKQTTTVETARKFSPNLFILILLFAAVLFGGIYFYFSANTKNSDAAEISSFKNTEIANWNSSPGEIYSVGSFSPDGKMIAFASTKSGTKNIWIKQTTSGEAVQITKDEFRNDNPVWSPDGEKLAFFSTRGNQEGIWQMPVLGGSPKLIAVTEGGNPLLRLWSKKDQIYYEAKNNIFAIDVNSGQTRQITDLDINAVTAESISISPDEQHIAYATVEGETAGIWTKKIGSDEPPKKLFSAETEIKKTVFHSDSQRIFYSAAVDGVFQIFVTDINGATPKQITSAENGSLIVDVSADGTKILYGSAKEESDVWSVNVKESKESVLTSDINSELWADASPDGKSIAFQSIKNLSQGNNLFRGNILVKNLGSNEPPREIVTNAFLPIWSPDGQQIAFFNIVGDKFQIEKISSSGSGRKILANDVSSVNFMVLPYNRTQTSDFRWSPDSKKIAYVSDKNGQNNIWLVNADGSGEMRLTDNKDANLRFACPLWSADGKQIAFTSKTNSANQSVYSVWLINTETKISRSMTRQRAFLRLIEWMQNDKELLLASTDGSGMNGSPLAVSIISLNIETDKAVEVTKLKETYLYNIYLSPDGKNIAFAAHREGKDNLWLIPVTGGAEKKLTDNNDSRLYFSSLGWSPDNNFIFFGKQSRYSLLSMLTNFK